MHPELSRRVLAAHLSVQESELAAYERGDVLMPLDIQGRLAAFVIGREQRLARLASRLAEQIEAARRYEAAEVVRHLTSPPLRW
jgi:hypothetical protein